MIDELTFADEETTRTRFTVKADNVLNENGFFSEAGLIENIAQTAAAGAGYKAMQQHQAVKAGFIGAVKDLQIFDLPKIGQLLETEVHIENQVFNVTIITGKVICEGTLLAQCEMKIFIAE